MHVRVVKETHLSLETLGWRQPRGFESHCMHVTLWIFFESQINVVADVVADVVASHALSLHHST